MNSNARDLLEEEYRLEDINLAVARLNEEEELIVKAKKKEPSPHTTIDETGSEVQVIARKIESVVVLVDLLTGQITTAIVMEADEPVEVRRLNNDEQSRDLLRHRLHHPLPLSSPTTDPPHLPPRPVTDSSEETDCLHICLTSTIVVFERSIASSFDNSSLWLLLRSRSLSCLEVTLINVVGGGYEAVF